MQAAEHALQVVVSLGIRAYGFENRLRDRDGLAHRRHYAFEITPFGTFKQPCDIGAHLLETDPPARMQRLDISRVCRVVAQVDNGVSYFECDKHPSHRVAMLA